MNLEPPEKYVIEDNLLSFEKKIGVCLPKEYRAFLLQYNGGLIQANSCRKLHIDGYHGDIAVDFFYELNVTSENCSLDAAYATNQEAWFVPVDVLAVGCSLAGDHFCVGLKENIYGFVFFVDHEEFAWVRMNGPIEISDSDRLPEGVYRVADNFEAFLAKIKE